MFRFNEAIINGLQTGRVYEGSRSVRVLARQKIDLEKSLDLRELSVKWRE